MLIACYGSLKKGYYNHEILGEDAKFLGRAEVKGVMYSNGSYPKLYRRSEDMGSLFGSEFEREHTIEIYDINKDAFKDIFSMEVGAGYRLEEVETPYGEAGIYYMPHEHFSSHDKWVEKY